MTKRWTIFTSFFNFLYSFRLRRGGGEAKLCWVPFKKGLFDVRSFYKVLSSHDSTHFPWKSISRNKVLLRVAFFAWLTVSGKILTTDNMRKRRIIVFSKPSLLPCTGLCCMYKKSGEFVDHLLLHCEVASTL